MATKATELAKQQNAMREQVLEQELSARSWKAYYEKMYYTIESGKLEEEYTKVVADNKAKFEKQQAQMQELLANLGSGVSDDKGTVTLKPTAEA